MEYKTWMFYYFISVVAEVEVACHGIEIQRAYEWNNIFKKCNSESLHRSRSVKRLTKEISQCCCISSLVELTACHKGCQDFVSLIAPNFRRVAEPQEGCLWSSGSFYTELITLAPPSTTKLAPVTYELNPLDKKPTTRATSIGRPSLPTSSAFPCVSFRRAPISTT
jgi:hypothetical protein